MMVAKVLAEGKGIIFQYILAFSLAALKRSEKFAKENDIKLTPSFRSHGFSRIYLNVSRVKQCVVKGSVYYKIMQEYCFLFSFGEELNYLDGQAKFRMNP